MADAITERVESISDPATREVLRDLNRRVIALEQGEPLSGSELPSSEWTKEELVAEADRRGLAHTSSMTKADLLDLLKT